MYLIGIHGKARAGKDTIAKRLCNEHGFLRQAFADPLKRAAQQMFGLTEAQTWDDDLKEVEIRYWGRSPRTLFQLLGTEGGRNVFGDDIWLRRWRLFYDEHIATSCIVVPDVRFENEADLIRGLGGLLLHVEGRRDVTLKGATAGHASEAGVTFQPGRDVRLANDGTIKELNAKVDQLVNTLPTILAKG